MESSNKIDLFGLSVESWDRTQVTSDLIRLVSSKRSIMVVTPNVDHFLRWQKDNSFRELYALADYRLIDGMPILWLSKLLSAKKSERITGVDLTNSVLVEANNRKFPLAIVGGSPGVMESARENITRIFPQIDLYLTLTPESNELEDPEFLDYLSSSLAKREEKIVLLCLGSPKQEKLYADLVSKHQATGVFLCVGGTIDFLANSKQRAPRLLQKIGFEWLFRFSQEPVRLFHRYFVRDVFIIRFLLRAIFLRIKKSKH
jgi:N-acetylglucosaminyldiphosphoundecaprenol N-acetyl-beta-D-mannosaminyltransferase